MKNKRKDQCQFCTSRRCHNRILRTEPPVWDEVACNKHLDDAFEAVDLALGVGTGITRSYISSTGFLKRGENKQARFKEEVRNLF